MKYLLYIALFSSLFSCSKKAEEQPMTAENKVNGNVAALTDKQIGNAGIKTALPEKKQISTLLQLNGKIDVPPQNMVSISVPLGGYLKTTNLLPGTRVKKGEILAVMEDQQYIQLQQDYLTGKERIIYLENEYLRQKELNSTQSASDKMYQQAETEFRSQQVMVNALYQKLQLTGINPNKLTRDHISRSINLYSPISGYVSKINVNIGKYVSPTEVLFELINPSDIHLALKVFEKDLDKIKIGQKLLAYTNSQPEKKYICEVILISKDLSADRNADVHCHFEKYDPTLLPGTFMNAEIALKTSMALVLPEDAVVSYEGKEYIFVPKGTGKFEMTEIKMGETENGFTEVITSADLSNQPCVVKGAYSLLMFLKNKSED
jgi:cobalt-zinc-cadmium efflux system membrane fusion protein